MKQAMEAGCRAVVEGEARLTRLDTIIGDGDHGICMKLAFGALLNELGTTKAKTIGELLEDAGSSIIKTIGGTAGCLFGIFFLEAGYALEGRTTLSSADFSQMFFRGSQGVQQLGKAQKGDKTMLDPLLKIVQALQDGNASDEMEIERAASIAGQAAIKGAQETAEMKSRQGRSKNFREQSAMYPDPGAITVSLFVDGFRDGLEKSLKETK